MEINFDSVSCLALLNAVFDIVGRELSFDQW